VGRPRLGLGTCGNIRSYKTPAGYRAETYFRDWDGHTRLVKRSAKTKRAAEQALKDALLDRQHVEGGDLSRTSTFAEVGERWLAEVRRREVGTTYDRYSGRLRNKIVPVLGELQLHECSTGVFERYVNSLQDKLSPATVRTYRTVLSGVMNYAVRMDVISRNPVREVAPIRGGGKKSRGLTAEERMDLLAKLSADQRAVDDDLPDLIRYLLGSGVRIGEAMGLRWFRVDLTEGIVVHGDNLVRETGAGLVLHSPKTEAGFRIVPLPEFVLHMLRVRYPGEGFGLSPVFGNAFGGWRDPINTARSIRLFRTKAGYPWFTSHVCRHTSITICDQAGLQAREISGYYGHARPSFTQDKYMDRRQQSGAVPRAIDDALRPARG
jgi:integrase